MEGKDQKARVGRKNQRYSQETGARMVAGCICLNSDKDKLIMILSLSHKNRWILPKGGIELDEGTDFIVSASRETWEEAGCEGKILRKLPVVQDYRGKEAPVLEQGTEFNPKKVIPKTEYHFYDMIVDELSTVWPELEKRQRRWCTYTEAKHELLKSGRMELVEVLDLSAVANGSPTADGVDEY